MSKDGRHLHVIYWFFSEHPNFAHPNASIGSQPLTTIITAANSHDVTFFEVDPEITTEVLWYVRLHADVLGDSNHALSIAA